VHEDFSAVFLTVCSVCFKFGGSPVHLCGYKNYGVEDVWRRVNVAINFGGNKTRTFNLAFMGPRIVMIILIYIQQDATLHSLFYLETALHVSGGISTQPKKRKQLYLQHLVFVTP
jgi:hypothetical protein